MRRICTIVLAVLATATVCAQEQPYFGPHSWQEQQRHLLNDAPRGGTPQCWQTGALRKATAGQALLKKVMGYHPYWRSNETITRYRYDLLSHVVYFSAEVNSATGQVSSTHEWLTTPLVDSAKANGCKVHLCFTCFGSSRLNALLGSQSARDTLIANIIRLVKARNADGANIDFESMPAARKTELVQFFSDLSSRLKAAVPGAEVSSAMPAVDWSNAWDMPALAPFIDQFFIMCYDYYWSGASTAGPVSPVQGGGYNVTNTLNWYIGQGIPKAKLLMGVPYYGYDWPVASDAQNAPTTGAGNAYIYTSIMNELPNHTRNWSTGFLNPWYSYQTTSWHQCWYDDVESMTYKYDLANSLDIGGVGMWALGYDDGRTELWDLLEDKFTSSTGIPALAEEGAFSIGEPYPQPVIAGTGYLSVPYVSNGSVSAATVTIYDVHGRAVRTSAHPASGNRGVFTLPLQGLPQGCYLCAIAAGSAVRTRAFVIAE